MQPCDECSACLPLGGGPAGHDESGSDSGRFRRPLWLVLETPFCMEPD